MKLKVLRLVLRISGHFLPAEMKTEINVSGDGVKHQELNRSLSPEMGGKADRQSESG